MKKKHTHIHAHTYTLHILFRKLGRFEEALDDLRSASVTYWESMTGRSVLDTSLLHPIYRGTPYREPILITRQVEYTSSYHSQLEISLFFCGCLHFSLVPHFFPTLFTLSLCIFLLFFSFPPLNLSLYLSTAQPHPQRDCY